MYTNFNILNIQIFTHMSIFASITHFKLIYCSFELNFTEMFIFSYPKNNFVEPLEKSV